MECLYHKNKNVDTKINFYTLASLFNNPVFYYLNDYRAFKHK